MISRYVVTILALGAAVGVAFGVAPGVAAADEPMISKVMGSIDIAPGSRAGDLSTVNGSVHIGADAIVGHAHAVNGGMHLESHATAAELDTVNGAIHVQDGGRVTGDVTTVNGGLSIENGADVSGNVHNINGGIHVMAAHVGGSIGTVSGNIDLGPDTHVDGDVVVKERSGGHSFGDEHIPHIVIGPGTVVKGTLRFERKVMLYVSDRATIGPVEGAEVLKFSGPNPPR